MLPPEQFYDMDMDDYKILQRAFTRKREQEEGWHRRIAWIVAEVVNKTGGGRGITQFMDNWWPYGSRQTVQDINKVIAAKRARIDKEVVQLKNNSILRDFFTSKMNKGANRRNKNSNRGGYKQRSPGGGQG